MYLAQHDVEHVTIVKCPKTEASRRAVPLQTIALEALERQRANRQGGLVFPAERGGHLDLHNTSTSWARLSDLASRRSRRSRSSSRSTPRCTRFESRPRAGSGTPTAALPAHPLLQPDQLTSLSLCPRVGASHDNALEPTSSEPPRSLLTPREEV
jgi:hypothetical protein